MSSQDSFDILGRVSMEDDASPVLQNVNSSMSSLGMIGTSVAVAIGMAMEQFFMSAMQDAIGAVETLVGDLFNAGVATQKLETVLNNLTGGGGEAVLDWADKLAEKTGIARDTIANLVEKQIEMGKSTSEAEALTEAMMTIGTATGASGEAISAVTQQLTLAAEMGSTATRAVRSALMQGIDIQPIMLAAVSSISGVTMKTLAEADTYLNKHKDAWASVFTYIEQNAGPMYSKAAGAVESTWSGTMARLQAMVQDSLPKIGEPIITILGRALSPLFDGLESFLSSGIATQIGGALIGAFQPVLTFLEPIIGQIGRFFILVGAGVNPLDALGEMLRNLGLGPLMDALQPLAKAFGDLFSAVGSHGPEMQAAIQHIGDVLMKVIGQDGPIVIANMSKAIENLAAFWKAHGAEIIAIITVLADVIIHVLGAAIVIFSGIAVAMQQMSIAIDTWLLEAAMKVPEFMKIAGDFINGMIQGIEQKIPELIAAAVKAVLAAWAAAKAALGIKSPSTLFAEIGANMMGGVSAGVVGATPNTMATVQGAMGSVAGAAGGVSGGGGYVSQDDNHTTSITFTGPITLSDDIDWQVFSAKLRNFSST